MQLGDMNYYYAARGTPQVQYGQEIRLPTQQQGDPVVFNARAFKIYGALLALMAAATLSLGIANVVLTKEAYCNPWNTMSPLWCSTAEEPYIWTWVAPGIWASIPIFFAGMFSMCISSNPGRCTRVFALLIFLSALVFAPGMCVLSSIEVWRGSEASYHFYKLTDGLMPGNIKPDDNPYQAKFAIPLVIAIIAAIMFLMTSVVTLFLCCCMQSLGIYQPQEIDALSGAQTTQVYQQAAPAPAPQQVIQNYFPSRGSQEVYYPSRPQVRNYYDTDGYRPPSDPYARFGPVQASVPTRYNPSNPAAFYGNFANMAPVNGGGGSFASEFFKPNPAYFWQ